MSHLSASELVDLAEGTLNPRRGSHADACETCRAQAAIVRDTLRLTKGANEVPEPSPLFWDHLSARIHDAVARAPEPSGWRWPVAPMRPIVAACAVAIVVIAAALLTRDARVVTPTPPALDGAATATDADVRSDPAIDPAHPEVWAVLTAAAADLQLDAAHDAGMAAAPAAIDTAVHGLTPEELDELGRLLQSALKRSSSGT